MNQLTPQPKETVTDEGAIDARSTELRQRQTSSIRWWAFALLLVLTSSPRAYAPAGAGRTIFAGSIGRENGIFVMDADGGIRTRLTSGGDGAPVWSPDGCRIVFRRGLRGIYVMDADGSNQTLVATTRGEDPQADLRSYFSPDGSRILFRGSGVESEYGDLYTVNLDGSNLFNLTNNTEWFSSDWAPSWSPDSSLVLFESNREPRGIYVVNADGTGERRLSAGELPAWSPTASCGIGR